MKSLIAAVVVLTLPAARARACTTFELATGADVAIGKCYDWSVSRGLVVVNKRGVAKRALALVPKDRPAEWTSAHASVTFNQYGIELPNGGMNDAGLVVEIMWLDSTKLPPSDSRPSVNELQWIQYQLDRYASTGEVVAHAGELRVSPVSGRVHYLVCDRSAACAAFEFVDGRLVITSGSALAARVLTNNTYAESMAYLREHSSAPAGPGSRDRFARAAAMAKAAPTASVTEAFRVLDSVNNRTSVWHIVYEPVRLRVEWRTRKQPKVKSVSLGKFDASCAADARVLDIDADGEGDVSARFAANAQEQNRRLVAATLPTVHGLSATVVDAVASYPTRQACALP